MNAKTDLWVDGEQIPDDRIEEIFQQPPGLPVRFLRSALIVGARGVGKTTLFRYLAQMCRKEDIVQPDIPKSPTLLKSA